MASNVPLRVARFFLSLSFLISFVAAARAQTATALTGVYNGKYTCGQGATNLKLSLAVSDGGDISALFTFYLPPGTQQQGYTYSLHGEYNLKTARVSLSPVRWETPQPPGFAMVGLNGTYSSDELSGAVYGPGCSTFNVERDKAESANIESVIAAQKDVTKLAAPPPSASAPTQEAYTTAPQAQAPAASASPAAPPKPAPAAVAAPVQAASGAALGSYGRARPAVPPKPAPTAAAPAAPPNPAPASAAPAPAKETYTAALQTQAPAASAKRAPAPPAPAPAKDPYMAALQAQAPATARSQPPTAPAPPPAAPKPAAQQKAAPPAPAPTAPVKAASSAAPGGPIKYLCYTTDPKQSVVYFTDIFDVPDKGSDAGNFVNYELAKIGFELYMNEKYTYVSSDPKDDHFVNCVYQAVGNQNPATVVQTVTAKKQSLVAEAAAAKKQVVSTGWKYVEEKAGATTVANTPAKPPAPASGASGGKMTDAQANAKLSDPMTVWKMDSTKDELTGKVSTPQPKAEKFYLDAKPSFYLAISASCANNGVGVFFLAGADAKDPVPQYAWYADDSDNSGEQIADVRIVVDGGAVHVAHAYPEKDGHTLYTNNLGLLFYEPNIVARSAQDQEDSANTGILALDGLIAPMVRRQAQANAQEWADDSAGPMTTLVNAKSLRVELPLVNESIKPIVDLNPQDPVLHQFVSDCYAKFSGGRR